MAIKRIPLRLAATVESRSEANAYLHQTGDAVLVLRGSPRLLLLKCPCGCGENYAINLDSRAGKAWRLYRDKANALTVYPSVWRDTGCQSHYVVRGNTIFLFHGIDDDDATPPSQEVLGLCQKLLVVWPAHGYHSFVQIAEQLDVIPWDVQEACMVLVQRGQLIRGFGRSNGMFARRS